MALRIQFRIWSGPHRLALGGLAGKLPLPLHPLELSLPVPLAVSSLLLLLQYLHLLALQRGFLGRMQRMSGS